MAIVTRLGWVKLNYGSVELWKIFSRVLWDFSRGHLRDAPTMGSAPELGIAPSRGLVQGVTVVAAVDRQVADPSNVIAIGTPTDP